MHLNLGDKILCEWTFARKARRELHFFTRHYNATYICDRCLAAFLYKQAPQQLNFGDASASAPWRRTAISHEAYVATTLRLTPWLCVPGFRLELAWGDLMHDLYLGHAMTSIASGLIDLLEGGYILDSARNAFASKDIALKNVVFEFHDWCKAKGLQTKTWG
jgi:hypothetical protein